MPRLNLTEEQHRIDRVAALLRSTYHRTRHDDHQVGFDDARPEERSAWRAVAAAAINILGGTVNDDKIARELFLEFHRQYGYTGAAAYWDTAPDDLKEAWRCIARCARECVKEEQALS